MTLNASGPISLGGSTSGQSVNLELGQSATAQISFNDTAVRTLTGTSAGTALIMPTNFYGKSNVLDTQTVTTGASGTAGNLDRSRGYINPSIRTLGSISPGTSSIYGGATILYIVWEERGGFPDSAYILGINGATNSGWTSMTIGSGGSQEILLRADAVYSSGIWEWSTSDSAATQAFGASGNVVSVVFS